MSCLAKVWEVVQLWQLLLEERGREGAVNSRETPGIAAYLFVCGMPFRSLLGVAARLSKQQAGRHFASAAGAAAAGTIARRVALLFPAAGLGVYAAVGDEPKRVAYTLSVLPIRLLRDVTCAAAILGGASGAFHTTSYGYCKMFLSCKRYWD